MCVFITICALTCIFLPQYHIRLQQPTLVREEMADIVSRLRKDKVVSSSRKTSLRHYCVATMILLHQQSAKSVIDFTVMFSPQGISVFLYIMRF